MMERMENVSGWMGFSAVRAAVRRALPLVAVALLTGCAADDESPRMPTAPTTGGDMFTRYVAMGQSNTAGFMSLGINEASQNQAYPVLIAERAGVNFNVPALAMPGCPPPLVGPQPVTSDRLGGATSETCALRVTPISSYISNVAVPGARIVDMVDNAAAGSPANALTTVLLGGRTQLEAMIDARPTFVSLWPEGNEVLQAALTGNPAAALPQSAYESALDQIVAGIRQAEAEAVFIGTINVMFTPALQPGAYYFALQAAGQSPKPVMANCAPGTPGGASLVAFSVLAEADVPAVSCDEAAPGVLSQAEQVQLQGRINAYNQALQARAEANGWAFVDPNPAIMGLMADPQRLRKCQGLATATPETFAQAVEATCPGPNAPNFWGSYLSYDPVHFNATGHEFFYNLIASAINAQYGTQLPTS